MIISPAAITPPTGNAIYCFPPAIQVIGVGFEVIEIFYGYHKFQQQEKVSTTKMIKAVKTSIHQTDKNQIKIE